VPAVRLASESIRAALKRAGASEDQVGEVIFGNVISAGQGQNLARQASIGAGLDVSIGATTVNKMCGSGLKSVMLAAQAIQCGDADLIVAGGAESMSRAPYLLEKGRTGYRMGDGAVVDSLIKDGLWDVYNDVHMGTCGDQCAAEYDISRQDQDDYAVASYRRALHAQAEGILAKEITPIEIAGRKGTQTVGVDEEPERFDEAKLRKLSPVFGKEGSVTAGNASTINDGAGAIVVLSDRKREELGVAAQAKILGYSTASLAPQRFTVAPISAVSSLLDKLSLRPSDIDLFEINEAFSVVPLAAMKQLELPHEKVNVHGGAVSIGHPIGASGTRTLISLLSALRVREAKMGVVTLCIGGGEAVALAVERVTD
jgi:acetyl-CoA C-acetyltransferase